MCAFFWRRERDSNPRGIAPKLISSQPRYDRFDISAYEIVIYHILIRSFEKRLEKRSFTNPLRMQG